MSIQTKQEFIPATYRDVTVSVTCDLCGAVFPGAVLYGSDVQWERGFDVAETCVKIHTGTVFPEGGSTVSDTWHICPSCFCSKLAPWLRTNGAHSTEEEHEH